MVGVINPANGTSIDIQRQAARNAPFQLLPGEPWPAEGNKSGSETTFSSSPSSPSSKNNASNTHHVSGGAIAGIVIGVVLLLTAGLASFILKRSGACGDVGDNQELGGTTKKYDNVSSINPGIIISHLNAPSTGNVVRSSAKDLGTATFDEKAQPREGHPGFEGSDQQTTIELEGDSPEVAELPTENDIIGDS